MSFKGTFVNLTLPSLHKGSLEIKLTIKKINSFPLSQRSHNIYQDSIDRPPPFPTEQPNYHPLDQPTQLPPPGPANLTNVNLEMRINP